MPRFKVVRKLPALYTEIWNVDAADAEEAKRAITGGRGQCINRVFTTTPRMPSQTYYSLEVTTATDLDQDPRSVAVENQREFMNSIFCDCPGSELQRAVQKCSQ